MKISKITILIVLCTLNVFGQTDFYNSNVIHTLKIKNCKIYTYENPNDYKDSVSKDYITDIIYFNSIGKIIKEENYNYTPKPKSIIEFIYEGKKLTKTTTNDNRKEIIVIDSTQNSLSKTSIVNNVMQKKNITYYDSFHREIKYENYKQDGSLQFSYIVNYIEKSSTVDKMVKGFLREQTETISPTSKIITQFDDNGKATDKVFQNYYNDGKQKEFCQIMYNGNETDFVFNCQSNYYDDKGRLISEINNGTEKRYNYNESDLLISYEFIEQGILRQLSIYKYE